MIGGGILSVVGRHSKPGPLQDVALAFDISERGKTVEPEFLKATFVSLGINVLFALIALFVSFAAIRFFDKRFLEKIDIEEELGKGNIAVAIFASSIMLFVAIIVVSGVR